MARWKNNPAEFSIVNWMTNFICLVETPKPNYLNEYIKSRRGASLDSRLQTLVAWACLFHKTLQIISLSLISRVKVFLKLVLKAWADVFWSCTAISALFFRKTNINFNLWILLLLSLLQFFWCAFTYAFLGMKDFNFFRHYTSNVEVLSLSPYY